MYKTGPLESVEDVDAFCRGKPGSFEADELDLSGTKYLIDKYCFFVKCLVLYYRKRLR